ncbi:sugar phosphate isomerase/epimerase family protein [Methylobacterium sp. J-077]|uniref:sugar phosphate isomerase/epimerase family protein n=1 Tax=Methylobacterium sp. J-077 TaxID=2836656 RepID=UPI001FB961A8|nr:sugar phosphate isomerase/epimerase family protein [Methylobacterium sp. J-077]MCJ2127158.1 sugar phosphate isomerase/epimerase [Methylobacterium sp. J-077]
MLPNGVLGTGLSAPYPAGDLSDLPAILDRLEALGVETIELPTFAMDLVVGGRIRRPHLERLKQACAGRRVRFTVHGPLAINFFDDPARLGRHFEVLEASLEIAAEIGAAHYVLHSGLAPVAEPAILEDAYARQREWLACAGEVARGLGPLICVETLFGGHEGKVHCASPARLAAELAAIDHPHVRATLDVSHSFLRHGFQGGDFVAEIAALAPFANHLHVHDSFGRADAIWMYHESERLAFGHGDLHLPVGWGAIPWETLIDACAFPKGVVFNIELNPRYWYAVEDCIAATKALAARARTQAVRPAA